MGVSWMLRPGRPSDVPAMYELDLVCFNEPFRFDLQTMRRFVMDPGAIVVVAEGGGLLVGFVVVHPVRRGRKLVGYVVTLDVNPKYRRSGLATDLIETAEAQTLEAGADLITLHVHTGNEPAIGFYEQAGYRRGESRPGFYGNGLDAWVYLKALTG